MCSVLPCDCFKLAEDMRLLFSWLIDVEGCVQPTKQRPSATLNASTAYQTLPIVEVVFLEDNSAFVSHMLVMTFGK